MLEAIESISGPYFLGLYAALAVVCLVLTNVLRTLLSRRVLAEVNINQLSNTEISLLCGGIERVAHSTVLVLIANDRAKIEKKKVIRSPNESYTPLEREAIAATEWRDFTKFKSMLSGEYANLLRRGLYYDKKEIAIVISATVACGAALLGFGLTKLLLSLNSDKPTTFLIISMVAIAVICAAMVMSILEHPVSQKGNETIEKYQKQFSAMRKTLPERTEEIALGIAIFGPKILAHSEQYSSFADYALLSSSSGGGKYDGCGECGGCGGCGGD